MHLLEGFGRVEVKPKRYGNTVLALATKTIHGRIDIMDTLPIQQSAVEVQEEFCKCTGCLRLHPANNTYFYTNSGGIIPYCKPCLAKKTPEEYVFSLEQEALGKKQCRDCKGWWFENSTYFYRDKNLSGGFKPNCKACTFDKEPKKYFFQIEQKKLGLRKCTQCSNWWPATPKYFHRSKYDTGGIRFSCKACIATKDPLTYWEKKAVCVKPETKKCPTCNQYYPFSFIYFHKDKKKKWGLVSRCKACVLKPINIIDFWREVELSNKGLRRCIICEEVFPKTIIFFSHHRVSFGTFKRSCRNCVKIQPILYTTYAPQLKNYEIVRRNAADFSLLEVICTYCGRHFLPTKAQARVRIVGLRDTTKPEGRFYCAEGCKSSCSIFGQSKYPKGFKKATSREVNPVLRKLVFERDTWECQRCEATEELHCHHILPKTQNPIFADDVDNCITLCKKCHKKAHQIEGCNYFDLRCS